MAPENRWYSYSPALCPKLVRMGVKSTVQVVREGAACFLLQAPAKSQRCVRWIVLYVLSLYYSLSAVVRLANRGVNVTFDRGGVKIRNDGALLNSGSMNGFLFWLDWIDEKVSVAELSNRVYLDIWNCSVAHELYEVTRKISTNGPAKD